MFFIKLCNTDDALTMNLYPGVSSGARISEAGVLVLGHKGLQSGRRCRRQVRPRPAGTRLGSLAATPLLMAGGVPASVSP